MWNQISTSPSQNPIFPQDRCKWLNFCEDIFLRHDVEVVRSGFGETWTWAGLRTWPASWITEEDGTRQDRGDLPKTVPRFVLMPDCAIVLPWFSDLDKIKTKRGVARTCCVLLWHIYVAVKVTYTMPIIDTSSARARQFVCLARI